MGRAALRSPKPGWGRPRSVLTDAGGRFALDRVAPGWTLLGPNPARREVFPFERFELARGEHRDVELRVLPRRRVLVELDLVGEVHGTPWKLPIAIRIERAESLAALTGKLMPAYDQAAPFQRTEKLSPGAHVVRARSRPWSHGSLWITAEWERCVEFTVAAGVDALRVVVPVPDLGPLAVVKCSLTAPPGATHVTAGWSDRKGQPKEISLFFDDGLRCELTIDLDEVPGRSVTICARAGSVRRRRWAHFGLTAEAIRAPGPQTRWLAPRDRALCMFLLGIGAGLGSDFALLQVAGGPGVRARM